MRGESLTDTPFSASNSSRSDCLLTVAMINASPGSGRVLGPDRHHGRQHREAFLPRQCPVVLPPVRGTAPDALAVGEIPARAAGPVHPVGGEIEPGFFRAHTSVAHDLQFQRAPAREPFVVQGQGVTVFGEFLLLLYDIGEFVSAALQRCFGELVSVAVR